VRIWGMIAYYGHRVVLPADSCDFRPENAKCVPATSARCQDGISAIMKMRIVWLRGSTVLSSALLVLSAGATWAQQASTSSETTTKTTTETTTIVKTSSPASGSAEVMANPVTEELKNVTAAINQVKSSIDTVTEAINCINQTLIRAIEEAAKQPTPPDKPASDACPCCCEKIGDGNPYLCLPKPCYPPGIDPKVARIWGPVCPPPITFRPPMNE
jgi:hypothetical protein